MMSKRLYQVTLRVSMSQLGNLLGPQLDEYYVRANNGAEAKEQALKSARSRFPLATLTVDSCKDLTGRLG